MKNLNKLFTTFFGIIALSAVMICVFIACDANDPGDDDDKKVKSKDTPVILIPAEYQNTIWKHYIDELQEDYSVKKVLDEYKLYLLEDKVTVWNYKKPSERTYPFIKTEPVDGEKVLQFDTKNEVAGLITFKNNVVINAIFPDIGSITGGWKEFVRYEDVVIDGLVYSFAAEGYGNEIDKDKISEVYCSFIGFTIMPDAYFRKKSQEGKKDLIILSKVNNIPVKYILYSLQDLGLTSVTIPDSVTKIGYEAFANNQLTSLIIGNNVTEIGDKAFYNNQLTSITIPNNVTIRYSTFTNDFDDYFANFYNSNGKAAGTYTRPKAFTNTWAKQ